MQTSLADALKFTHQGQEADSILRSCVHCGFCNATCPTYQLLGDELDGPRGRIYLIKQVLEGQTPTAKTQLHLDRCLTCRACETVCPSGVRYGQLLDIGRAAVAEQVVRPLAERIKHRFLRAMLAHPRRFQFALGVARMLRPLLPAALRRRIPQLQHAFARPGAMQARTVLMLEGCVQPALSPNINAAAARVLDKLGIAVKHAARAGCCGALSQHLDAHEEALNFARRNIDAWWPFIEVEDGDVQRHAVEAIVITASGCGVFVKDYGRLLRHDAQYAAKAARIAAISKDISEILAGEDLARLTADKPATKQKIAFHSPCTLQHGQRLDGVVEKLLTDLGVELLAVTDAHLCCGSAGTYSLLQPDLSQRLLKNKLENLQSGSPAVILTANIGCLAHMQPQAGVPVRHWIEWVAEAMNKKP